MMTSFDKLRSEYELEIKKYCLAEVELQKRKDMIAKCSTKMQCAIASVRAEIDEYSGIADRIELMDAEERISQLRFALCEIVEKSGKQSRCGKIALKALEKQ